MLSLGFEHSAQKQHENKAETPKHWFNLSKGLQLGILAYYEAVF
jgi:hypothetical protein